MARGILWRCLQPTFQFGHVPIFRGWLDSNGLVPDSTVAEGLLAVDSLIALIDSVGLLSCPAFEIDFLGVDGGPTRRSGLFEHRLAHTIIDGVQSDFLLYECPQRFDASDMIWEQLRRCQKEVAWIFDSLPI